MSNRTDKLVSLISTFGLHDEEANVYLYLLEYGASTALTLSRQLKMGRTKVYRIIDSLKSHQLVEFQINPRGLSFSAAHPSRFQQLIIEQEQKTHELKQALPDILGALIEQLPRSKQDSKVLTYEGIEGLKQVSYNITRAKDVVRVFEVEHMSDFLPHAFAESIRRELVKNKITTLDLTNKQNFDEFTEVSELVETYSQSRYIDPQKLKINFEVLIYNDVYATYSYKNETIFCIEVYNQELAEMQKQIFDFIWSQATPLKFLNERGAASI